MNTFPAGWCDVVTDSVAGCARNTSRVVECGEGEVCATYIAGRRHARHAAGEDDKSIFPYVDGISRNHLLRHYSEQNRLCTDTI